MRNSKIDWCDHTWNPVTGCMNDCEYCFARGIANRFSDPDWKCENCCFAPGCNSDDAVDDCYQPYEEIHDVEFKKYYFNPQKYIAYPYGFEPTFHRYRLDLPRKIKTPGNIFVCSMADLFGEWVPDKWIGEVFKSCEKAPQHNYLFLTKNPKNPWRFHNLTFNQKFKSVPQNMWFGFSVTTQEQLNNMAMNARWLPENAFVSIEPIHGEIQLNKIYPKELGVILDFLTGKQYWFMGGDHSGQRLKWVIVGAETGHRKDKITPKKEWIESIVDQCKAAGVPIFMKESLRSLMGDDFIQEWPEELKR